MTIRARLLFIFGLVCVAVVAMPLTMYIVQTTRMLQLARLKYAGIAPSHALLRVVQLQQQHRGLSSGVLGGYVTMEAQRAAKQAEADKAVEAFDAMVASDIRDPTLVADWRRTAETWRQLAHGVASRSITGRESLARHTALIGDNLTLLNLLLDYFGLSYDPTGHDYHLTKTLLVYIPTLTEFLGQVRARGMLLLAGQHITLADRTVLIELISNVERQHEFMVRELGRAITLSPQIQADLDHTVRISTLLERKAINLAKTQVVEARTLSYSPADYFALFTQAIDGQFALLDKAMVNLDGALQGDVAALQGTLTMTMTFIAGVMALAVWLGTVIVRVIKRDIAALRQSDEAQRRYAVELSLAVEARTQELCVANGHLAEASRHKSTFLANMSHEVRTPLNNILGFSDLLHDQASGPLTPTQTRYLDHIQTSGRHLLALINDLLDLSKVEAGKLTLHPEPIVLAETLAAIRYELQPVADAKGLTLTLEADSAPATLIADPVRFRQILYNLLSNAIKFSTEDGRVTVAARRVVSGESQPPNPGSQIPPVPPFNKGGVGGSHPPHSGEFVEIAVTDAGMGITAEEVAKLFQPFTQLELTAAKHMQGTGLGLALTKQLVELHGGTIAVTSAGAGCGSTFTLLLPLGLPAGLAS